MTNRSQRFIVWFAALFLIISLYKGHCSRTEPGPAVAFRSSPNAGIAIRVRGDVPHQGIYRLPDGATLGTVTNMTITNPAIFESADYNMNSRVKPGMIVEFKYVQTGKYVITVNYMKAKERIILGIPLDLELMDEADWDALPGIGQKTAREIIFYRQNNGDFPSLDDLKNVPGISDGKFQKIKSFFYLH